METINQKAIVVLGPTGSGKTSLCHRLAEEQGWEVIGIAGQYIDTCAGEPVRPLWRVDEKEWTGMDRLDEDVSRGRQRILQSDVPVILFDGFPFAQEHLDLFFQVLAEGRLELTAVVVMHLSFRLCVKRLTGRRLCSECGREYNLYFSPSALPLRCDHCGEKLLQRSEDRYTAVLKELQNYKRHTMPVLDYLRRRYRYQTYDLQAGGSEQETLEQAMDALMPLDLRWRASSCAYV